MDTASTPPQDSGKTGGSGRSGRPTSRRAAKNGPLGIRPRVPRQTRPSHDNLAPTPPAQRDRRHPHHPHPARRTEQVPLHASWTEPAPGRWFTSALLVGVVLVGLGCLALALTTESRQWFVGLALAAVVAVVVRGAVISSTPLTVRLDGSNLTLHRGRTVDVYDLTDTFHLVETVGDPGRPGWRLRLEAVDGTITELTPQQVDPHVLTDAVALFRTRPSDDDGGPEWWRFRD